MTNSPVPRTQDAMANAVAKVPAITLGFWVIKILATTLGETGGDAVTMSMHLGYLTGTAIFATLFTACVLVQIRAKQFHPLVYWTTIVASTTVGTTLADFVTRSIGIGYTGGAALLLALVIASLWAWQRTLGTVSVASVGDPKSEWFYWTTITLSQTLGTALGDWVADTAGVGYVGGIVVFGTALAIVAFLHLRTHASKTVLFWAAFVLTRPLGAVVGDFLDKPIAKGGLDLSRFAASAWLAAAILACVLLLPQRAAERAH